jgi:hypothetical protein
MVGAEPPAARLQQLTEARRSATPAERRLIVDGLAKTRTDHEKEMLLPARCWVVDADFTRRELKLPKTECSRRAVPLQRRALDALDRLPESNATLVFPGERGAYLDMHHFRP